MAELWTINEHYTDVYGYISSETYGTLGQPYTINISLQDNYYWTITGYYYPDNSVSYSTMTIASGCGGKTITWTPPVSYAAYTTQSNIFYVNLHCEVRDTNNYYVINEMHFKGYFRIPLYPELKQAIYSDNKGWLNTFGNYVQNESQLHVKITAEEASSYGVPIDRAYITVTQSGKSLGSYQITAVKNTDGTYDCDVDIPLTVSGNIMLSCTIYDERHNSTNTSKSLTVLEYIKPTISITQPYRCDLNGTAQYDGDYACVSLDATATSLNSSNTLAARIKCNVSNEVELPSGYTRLEYIESSGTQYIITGITPNQDTRVVCKATVPVSTTANFLFGARTDAASNTYSFLAAPSGYYRTDYGTEYGNFSSDLNTSDPIIIDKNKNVTTINGGNAITAGATTFTAPGSLVLFGVNTKGTVSYYGSTKIYYCKIYDNGELVRDYYPVLSSDGDAGLYDAVHNSFSVNAGSGYFIEGPSYSSSSIGDYTTNNTTESTLLINDQTVIFPVDADTEYIIVGECEDRINTVESTVKYLLKVAPLIDIDRANNAFGFGIIAGDPNTALFGPKIILRQGGIFEGPATFNQAATFKEFTTFEQGTNLPMYGYNFLDNSDFTNIVNQGICTSSFVFDRWHGDCTVTEISENSYHRSGITIPSGGKIWQAVPIYDTDLNNKSMYNLNVKNTLTLAAMTTDGTVHILTGKIDESPSSSVMKMYRSGSTYRYGYVELYTGSYKWIALYEGEYNEGTLPAYRSKGYYKELETCRKYCQTSNYSGFGYYDYSYVWDNSSYATKTWESTVTIPDVNMNMFNGISARLSSDSFVTYFCNSDEVDFIKTNIENIYVSSYKNRVNIDLLIKHGSIQYYDDSLPHAYRKFPVYVEVYNVIFDASM